MKLTDTAQAKNLEQLRSLKRKKLVERHKGVYVATCYPENHLLPFESKLRSLEKTSGEFTNCSEFDFLYQGKPETPLSKKGLRGACEALYTDSDKGEDYFSYAKETISKHIKTITGKSLAEWLEDKEFDQDAFKTAYLLYDLHLATPSGLEMLPKKADPRFAEVELFTSHHQPKNRNTKSEEDQVIVLSAWLKEFFSKTLFHRSEIERGMAKNLDMIFTGYHSVYQYVDGCNEQLRAKLHSAVFDEQILARKLKPREPLSTELMRAWQGNVKYHNLSNCAQIEIQNCFLKAGKQKEKQRTITAKVDDVLLLGARLFSWLFLQDTVKVTFHQLSDSNYQQLLNITTRREKLIYAHFTNDYQNGVKLSVKGIGEDSKRTSLFNSLEGCVDSNRSLLTVNMDPFAIIKLDNNCETHHNYLRLRAIFACQEESISAQEFLSRNQRVSIQYNNTVVEYVENYINSMTLDELNSDINRINKVLSKHIGSEFMLLPTASEKELLNQGFS